MPDSDVIMPGNAGAPPSPADSREITWQSLVGAAFISAIVAASYPYVVLKIGQGPNVSVVSAFLGALFLNVAAYATRGRNRLLNNIIQTAGTSAASTAFMCIVAAAFGYLEMNETVNVKVHIGKLAMFAWLTCSGVVGVLFTVVFRKMFIEDPKMIFADGVAAAETIVVLDGTGHESRGKMKALGLASAWSALVNFIVEAVPALWDKVLIPYGMLSTRYLMGFDWSMLNIGTGLLVGLRVGVSMILGSLVLWFIIGPHVMDSGIGLEIVRSSVAPHNLDHCAALAAHLPLTLKPDQLFFHDHCGLYPKYAAGDWFRIVLAWAMWPATALMVTSAVTSVVMRWKSIVATFRELRSMQKKRGGEDLSLRVILVGGLLFAVLLAIVQKLNFEMSYLQSAVAVLASLPLMLVAIRVLGETNSAPISVMANALQAIFAVFWPQAIGLNLVGAGMAGSIASNSTGTIQDYRTGQIVGSTPRILTWVQLAAVPIGAAAVAIMYPLLVKTYGLGEGLTAPTGLKIANMSVLLSKGFSALPAGCLKWTVIAAVWGVVSAILEEKTKWAEYLPSAAAFGFALILPGTLNIPQGLGGVAGWVWMRNWPKSYEKYAITVASGLIAGEALLGGVVIPVLLTALRG